ncbi:MAG: calcium-binding protein [Nitrospira sp.]|nr:calcium-binding protein [Nitrospira sp.]
MAIITGSTSIDWSTVSLGQVDFAAHFVQASNRSDQIGAELESGNWSLISASSTRVVVRLNSGGRLTIGGSGLLSSPIIRSVSFSDPDTGEILRYTGLSSNGTSNGFLTSLTFGTTSFSETFIGNVTTFENDPDNQNDDTYAGPVTSLTAKIGTATIALSGSFTLTGDNVTAALTGTVTGIVVVSGTNSIKMTGLAIDIDVIEAAFASDTLSTVNDLFSVVGDQLNGDDLITYRNNSGVGMSFFGGAGNDTINISGLRGDTLIGGGGNDQLIGGLGQDTVNGGAGNDQITMLVTAGNVDTIDAGADTDTLVLSGVVGGNHEVVVDLSSLTDQVVLIGNVADAFTQISFENLNASGIGSFVTVTGSAGDNVIIGSNGADIINGGGGNDTLNGGAGNDQLIGGTGNDVLNGGTGIDNMTGGAGDDTYAIDNLLDVINEAAGDAHDTVQINRTVDLNVAPFSEIEHVVLTGTAALNATGDSGNNHLTGNNGANILNGGDGDDALTGGLGNDTLNGGTGDDALDGGAGNDTYVVDSTLDTVTEALAGAVGGVDVVQSLATHGNIEHLTLTGNGNDSGTGNSLNNILTGNSGNNQLTGGAGNDTLVGGLGNDLLDGGAGADRMTGGLGDDTYVRDAATDVITEGLTAGTDTVQSALNYTLGANVENLELTGTAVTGTGNALQNTLTGNSGNNTLSGLAGNDTLHGGVGNDSLDGGLGQDTVLGGNGDDRITMLVTAGNVDTIDAGEGEDTLVLAGVVSGTREVVLDLSLADHIISIGGVLDDTVVQSSLERLDASGLVGVVNVKGGDGDSVLIGSRGNDRMDGGAGNDLVEGGAGDDALDGDEGDDTLNGGAGNDELEGNSGNDTLNGGLGNDTLEGDEGDDTLNGGVGNDTYEFGRGDGQDLITDNSGTADKLDFNRGLTLIDPADVILSRQADNLHIAIEGTSDQLTIQNWYTSATNRVEIFESGSGNVLLSTQVEQLIQAMAAFTTNTGLSWEEVAGGAGTAQQQQQFNGIIASNWRPDSHGG